MKYLVRGADRETGEEIEMTLEASSEGAAAEFANRKGVLVSAVVSNRVAAYEAPRPPVYRPPLEAGHMQGAPVINIATPRRGSSLGIASTILGTLAFLICWVPLVNLLGLPLSAIGLLLGLIGVVVAMTRNGSGIGFPIAGSAISAVALIVVLGMVGLVASGTRSAARRAVDGTNETTTPLSRIPAANTQDPAWVDVASPGRLGEIELSIEEARVGVVTLKSQGGYEIPSSKPYIAVTLGIRNASAAKKVDYHTWGDRLHWDDDAATLLDNFGNAYRCITFGFAAAPVGRTQSASIYPGSSVVDVLLFEPPIDSAEYLTLELPGRPVGEEATIRFRIPAAQVQK